MKITTLMLAATGLVVAAGLGVAAQVHGGHGGHGHHADDGAMAAPHMVEWLVDNALDDVGASDAQRAKVLAVKDRVMNEAKTLHAGHDATHEEFLRQWELDKMDSARLHALVGARLEEMKRVLHTAVDGVVEVHDTLTPEQRKTLIARVHAMHGAK